MLKKHKTALAAAIILTVLGGAVFNFAGAETIENLEKKIGAAQKELSALIPLLDNSGGPSEENNAIKKEIGDINSNTEKLTSQWQNIKASPTQNQNEWQTQMIKNLEQTIETIKSAIAAM